MHGIAFHPPHVNFVVDARATHWPDLETLTPDDISRTPHRFVGGRNSWIAQTFLRLRPLLRARGWKVTAGSRYEPGSITIVHRDDANAFLSQAFRTFLVVVRADRQPAMACDFAVVQNGLDAMPHERFIPLWPQPGLVARNARRGNSVRRIAYMGRTTSQPAWFSDAAFHAALARRGVEFEVRTSGWEHYDDVDLVVAARDEVPVVLANKPATKLYNGWLAGVPVLASAEPAYEELRRSRLDYVRIENARDVIRAVDRLQGDPATYAAMVANGRERAREFDVGSIGRKWCALLEEEVLPRQVASQAGLARRAAWYFMAMADQKARSKQYKVTLAMERHARASAAQERPPREQAALVHATGQHAR